MERDIPPADLMSDRRRHLRRLTVKELIGVQLGAGNRGIVVDLSETGMRVQAAARVQMLPSTLLRFQIPGCSAPLAASCEVAWADGFGKAGLRFTGFSGNSLLDLRRWLRSTSAPIVEERKEPAGRGLPLPMPKPQVVTGTGTRPVLHVSVHSATSGAPVAAQVGRVDTFEARLHGIAQNLVTLTSADGAMVALRAGERIVCRASVGAAPPPGAPLPQDAGLAGECIRKGAVVWCVDTQEDARVNREACQRLNLRSTVLAPVLRDGLVHAVLEVFSSRPRAFDRSDIMAVTRMAEILAGTLAKQEAAARTTGEMPVATQARQEAGEGARPTQATQATQVGPTREAAMRLPQPVDGVVVCDACGHRNPDYVKDCENCDVPLRVPELEVLLDRRGGKISNLLLALFMVMAPLGCFHAGRELGMMTKKKPAVQQTQPARTDAGRPEVARKM